MSEIELALSADFLKKLSSLRITNSERAIALIWFAGFKDHLNPLDINEITNLFEAAGYPKQNRARLKASISKDKRTTKTKDDRYRINVKSRTKLDEKYIPYVDFVPIKISNSVLPTEIYKSSRSYIERVVKQINASYDAGLYDCCAVMCRRLLETLIIEVYESLGEADKLKSKDGDFQMFSGLKSVIENDSNITLSRNTKQGLSDLKKLGDLSAHSRRFNARKNDIDRITTGIRVASEELLHLANLD